MTHTPAPWNIEIGSEHCFHDGNRIAITHTFTMDGLDETATQTIAEIWPGDDDCDIKDARLIAAAPDLLDALQAFMDLPAKRADVDIIQQAAAAIDKAIS